MAGGLKEGRVCGLMPRGENKPLRTQHVSPFWAGRVELWGVETTVRCSWAKDSPCKADVK
ncbi:hypothetical protein Tsubulata_028320 [Turnera subulata]|uniref:Uncharacterized protein n=1 Tax=Turnera subulata TaxID=218843 RepID=A0A9Q0FMR9_9ROSI|nr:hypothetical protein Tsubulata_028320 [Turnera subulata]